MDEPKRLKWILPVIIAVVFLGVLRTGAHLLLIQIQDAQSQSATGPKSRASVLAAIRNSKDVPGLLKHMESQDAYVREAAIWALGDIGPEAAKNEKVVPALISVLKDEIDPWVVKAALFSLRGIGPVASTHKEAVPTVIKMIKDDKMGMRLYAMDTLEEIGASPEAIIPAMINALKDENSLVSGSAVNALAKMGPAAASELVKALKDENATVRRTAAYLLGSMGLEVEKHKDVVPALIKAVRDVDPVKAAAVEALLEIGPNAVSGLTTTLKDDDVKIRSLSAFFLGRIGPAAKDAIPALTDALKDKDVSVRIAAREAIDKIKAEK